MHKEIVTVYKEYNKIPLPFNPLLLFLFAILGDAIFELYFHNQYWSPFSYSPTAIYNGSVIILYVESFIAISLGFLFSYISYDIVRIKKACDEKKFTVRIDRLNLIAFVLFVILLLNLIISQLALGNSNFINILHGKVSALLIHKKIKKAYFGNQGISLITAYCIVILWYSYKRLNLKVNKWLKAGVILALFQFISISEAQGFLYFFSAYIMQKKADYKTWIKILLSFIIILIVFIITRIIRNPGHNIMFNFHNIILFIFGPYLGSPVANTTYIFINHYRGNFLNLFANMIPHKLANLKSNLQQRLPDPMSPEGLVGAAFMFGGAIFLFYYSLFIGVLVSWFYIMSRKFFSFEIFLPFLLVTVAFCMMYNNFLNLNFFWIPLLFSFIVQWSAVKPH